MSEHEKPLAPGEIRRHTVGAHTFQVMHVDGDHAARVIYSMDGAPVVICGSRWERVAVRAYADAIEQAESDRIDALDDADDVAFIDSASGELIEPGLGDIPQDRSDDGVPEVEQQRHSGLYPEDLGRVLQRHGREILQLPIVLDVAGASTPAPTLADDVAALRNALKPLAEIAAGYHHALMPYLDRIAGRLPQRATDPSDGALYYLHDCGHVQPCGGVPTLCFACSYEGTDGWRPLYTLPDGGA